MYVYVRECVSSIRIKRSYTVHTHARIIDVYVYVHTIRHNTYILLDMYTE